MPTFEQIENAQSVLASHYNSAGGGTVIGDEIVLFDGEGKTIAFGKIQELLKDVPDPIAEAHTIIIPDEPSFEKDV